MPRFSLRRAIAAAVVASPIAVFAPSAWGLESLTVGANQTVVIDGSVKYKTVTVETDGVLVVRTIASGGSGRMTLAAETVVVKAGGQISASAAGHTGTTADGSAPLCCAGAGGKAGPAMSTPGGGGGSGGPGAKGCGALGTQVGSGGDAYITASAGNPGAAGGAATVGGSGDVPNLGGRGGGSITIVASEVQVDGAILADGAPGVVALGVGSGGGAGGYISIAAYSLTGSGSILARGGNGAVGKVAAGGGGGGGVIQLSAALTDANGFALVVDAAGGTSGTCPDGGVGKEDVNIDPTIGCTDADGDMHTAEACGGDDCDDTEPSVFNGALEVCDGLDNNCDGTTDGEEELVKDACGANEVCKDGACEDESTGTGGSGGGQGNAPDYVQYRGACSAALGAAAAPSAAGVSALLLAAASALRARRRRRSKR
ncbi:MAG: hypothetical protein IPK82_33910 [Polyangiaceae bacterium]|nr:hypothetical protein [Polyangiaceae bacterium]